MKKYSEFQSVFIVFIPSGVFAFVMHMYFYLLLTLKEVNNQIRYKILCMLLKLKWGEVFR